MAWERAGTRGSLCIFTTGASLASYVSPCQWLVYTASNRSCKFRIKNIVRQVNEPRLYSGPKQSKRLTQGHGRALRGLWGHIYVCENVIPIFFRYNVKFTDVTSAYVFNGASSDVSDFFQVISLNSAAFAFNLWDFVTESPLSPLTHSLSLSLSPAGIRTALWDVMVNKCGESLCGSSQSTDSYAQADYVTKACSGR